MTDTSTPSDKDDLLAAEYVIGLLDGPAREDTKRRARADVGFAKRVAAWQTRLEDFNADYGTQKVPARVKARIDNRLFAAQKRGWFNWIAAGLVAAALIMGVSLYQSALPSRPDLQAQLAGAGSPYTFDVSVDLDRNLIALTRLSGDSPPEGVFELWLVPQGGVPLSLGIFEGDQELTLAQSVALTRDATLAISLEPLGGSPTGAPTGPVIAAGVLENV